VQRKDFHKIFKIIYFADRQHLADWGRPITGDTYIAMEAGPVLLEPIASLKVTVPDQYTGDVMGDLNKRRGRVLGMNPIGGGKQVVEAEIPMTGLYGYCTVLRSMTGGRGVYEYEFVRYEQCPSDVQEKEVAARASKLVDENAE